MEANEIVQAKDELDSLPTPSHTVAVAISGGQKSNYIVKWALDKFAPGKKVLFRLIHVCRVTNAVPTPMGNSIPISQVRDEVAVAYRKEVEWQTKEKLLPYKELCTRRKVSADVIVIESNDIASAIAGDIAKCTINELVIGVSSRNLFRRKVKGRQLSSRIAECAPSFCTVYAVSKGKLSSVRQSFSETNESLKDDSSDSSTTQKSSYSRSSQSDKNPFPLSLPMLQSASDCRFHPLSLPMQQCQALSTINQTLSNTGNHSLSLSRCQSLSESTEDDFISICPSESDVSHLAHRISSYRGLSVENHSLVSDQMSTSDGPPALSPEAESQIDTNIELERLKIDLRHARGLYAIARSETIDAARKLTDLNKRCLEENIRLKELNHMEEEARESVAQEKEKYEAVKREAEFVRECAEREALHRKDAERKALRESREKAKLENALVGTVQQYQKFTWEEIVSATSSFSESLRIGMGAYGTVYKGTFHHTTAAVKVLHLKEALKNKQFQQELEILSKIRHPHLLLLIGACPEHGCIVYEYMENGSLEDRLFRKNGSPPIPWLDRFRVAREVASALVFLHTLKPEPVVHRDLKPANILLDHNFVSRIGDVGVSTMLRSDQYSSSSISKDMNIVGTMCYIDPEYQRTGLSSPKSDVYALGMVILQLLTSKPVMALAHVVETAIDSGNLMDILDSEAGEWPIIETKELAALGLRCSELRRKDRPDLKDQVLPVLERLEKDANKTGDTASFNNSVPPNHFICPILQDVMNDPCVASDGFTYDRKAIETWFEGNEKSPLTNMTLPNKTLIPNFTLLSAIMDWKARRRQ